LKCADTLPVTLGMEYLAEGVRIQPGAKILDVGCGMAASL
jgi:cyclopropane fatty-acyl-phospholipid synthase-like methyltransferase